MTLELEADGHYLLRAEGLNATGEKVSERPQRMIPDDRGYPVPDFPGLTAVSTRLEPRTLQTEVRREDGSLVGQGTFVVSPDGKTLAATNSGFDTQMRQFRQYTVWEKEDLRIPNS
jgi:hypothetical protein